MDEKTIIEAVRENNFELVVRLCEEAPYRLRHPELLPALHLLCQECSDSSFFKEAWSFFLEKGLDPYEEIRNCNPLEYLILKNPAFFNRDKYPDLPLQEAFWWVYTQFYSVEHLPPDFRENHLVHFLQSYSDVLPGYQSQLSEPVVGLLKYKPKQTWFDYVPSRKVYQAYREILSLTNISDISFNLTGSKSKSFKHFIENNWMNFNFDLLGVIHQTSKLNIKHEEKMNILNFYAITGPNDAFPKHIANSSPYNKILEKMSFKRFFKIFIQNPYFNHDLIRLLDKMENLNLSLNFKDFKTAKDLHDYCSQEINRIEREVWEQRTSERIKKENDYFSKRTEQFKKELEIIKPLNGKKFNNIELHVPENPLELFQWGNELRICVGSNYYIDEIRHGNLKIIFIKKDGQAYGCCAVASGSLAITEIRGPGNRPIDDAVRQLVLQQISLIKDDIERKLSEEILDKTIF